jgi:hypothetical protein
VRPSNRTIVQSEAFVRKGLANIIKLNLPDVVENRHVRRAKKKMAKSKLK